MAKEFPANRFQVRLYATDGSGDSIPVAHSLTLAQARDVNAYPCGTIERNGRKWIYSYSLNAEYCRDMVR
mgnify:CR=1 FL=1